MGKIRVGIIFGGNSREREVSFAGGRTVYDNLNKELFEPVPIFVDSFGQFIYLKWEYIYKGSIRDFYPAVEFLPVSPNEFQVYAECLSVDPKELIPSLGEELTPDQLPSMIDFAFLCLHGRNGEDGRIQGLLEYYGVPYSGSGILPSSIGMNKAVQKQLMKSAGFKGPKYITVSKADSENIDKIREKIKAGPGFPCVVKAANQGSSIGLSVIESDSVSEIETAVNKAFFRIKICKKEWGAYTDQERIAWVRTQSDIREGIGLPCMASLEGNKPNLIIRHPEDLLKWLNYEFNRASHEEIVLESIDGEEEILIEEFVQGKEFSCIVLENGNEGPLALPPTEIRKGKELFDYRSKYLPGLSRKITPIDLPDNDIQNIREACQKLYSSLFFNVYARIDGFLTTNGEVFLNDPNTTSGMMPSSFFFHQAAEIGLDPSQFLTLIISLSLEARIKDFKDPSRVSGIKEELDDLIKESFEKSGEKTRVAVILGGYSSERHISVESGRNVFEKLASSGKYDAFPVFLSGNEVEFQLHTIPINLLLKDNADDIKEKVNKWTIHPIIHQIVEASKGLREQIAGNAKMQGPEQIDFNQLKAKVDVVFIALHGRPGEDGQIQQYLDKVGLPYNGSGPESSRLTINKFNTNEIMAMHGLGIARHGLYSKDQWKANYTEVLNDIEAGFSYPLIAKPVDDGCSSAVKKIKTATDLKLFLDVLFRDTLEIDEKSRKELKLQPKEEFPKKDIVLIEELIAKKDYDHFLEITGGMLTYFNEQGEVEYEVFESSEALSEGDVLSLEEKFLAGQGQNITPARYSKDEERRQRISDIVKEDLKRAAIAAGVEGYCRIDAFVGIKGDNVDTIIIEINSLPGMTPATCIYHQAAINHYRPFEFIDKILSFGIARNEKKLKTHDV